MLVTLFREDNGNVCSDDKSIQVALEPEMSRVRDRTGGKRKCGCMKPEISMLGN